MSAVIASLLSTPNAAHKSVAAVAALFYPEQAGAEGRKEDVMKPYGRVAEITEDELPLQSLYRWERERGDRTFLTQPFGGAVRE